MIRSAPVIPTVLRGAEGGVAVRNEDGEGLIIIVEIHAVGCLQCRFPVRAAVAFVSKPVDRGSERRGAVGRLLCDAGRRREPNERHLNRIGLTARVIGIQRVCQAVDGVLCRRHPLRIHGSGRIHDDDDVDVVRLLFRVAHHIQRHRIRAVMIIRQVLGVRRLISYCRQRRRAEYTGKQHHQAQDQGDDGQ